MANNYELMRDQMERRFLSYDQEQMIQKLGLSADGEFIYIRLLGRSFRVNRQSGRAEWSEDGFVHAVHADYASAMTIFDLLCDSQQGAVLSGEFVSVNQLPNIVVSSRVGSGHFSRDAAQFAHRTEELRRACIALGGVEYGSGDVGMKLSLFDNLPIVLRYYDADDEFPPSLTILWDKSTLSFIRYETTYYAVGLLLSRLSELMESAQ